LEHGIETAPPQCSVKIAKPLPFVCRFKGATTRKSKQRTPDLSKAANPVNAKR
jgi:hypothetical protein